MRERRRLVDGEHPVLSLRQQCLLLGIGRTSIYYTPQTSDHNKQLMDRIDELFTEDLTRGTRRLSAVLRIRFGLEVGRDKVRSLMRRMGLAAICPKKDLSRPNRSHKKHPYLLRDLKIARGNQVWSTDITYIRLRGGFVYLCAIIDWYSRCVLSWRVSTTMESDFCIKTLKEALARWGHPEIFNSDQGSQFTCEDFTGVLKDHRIRISMDGRGRALDNVFVERLWRTVKYEDVYLKDYQTLPACRKGLEEFFDRYNHRREHSSLEYRTPMDFYLESVRLLEVA